MVLGMMPYPVKVLVKAFLSPRYYFRILTNDARAYFGLFSSKVHVIFIAGLPKSGTTWVENFISNIPGYNPRVLTGSRELLRQHCLPTEAVSKSPKYGYSAIKTHTDPTNQNIDVLVNNGVNKILVMYRDPRDVAISTYYYVLKNKPWEPSDWHYADYSEMSKEEGLSHSVEFVIDDCVPWIKGWIELAKNRQDIECKMLKYEDLLNNPIETFHGILSFFEINLSEAEFDSVMHAIEEGKEKKEEAALMLPGKKTTKRKGVVGEWRNELNFEQKRIMKEAAGDLLVELGYEDNFGW